MGWCRWYQPRPRVPIGRILHPRICAIPDLAQALYCPIRGWWHFAGYCACNNIYVIIQQVIQQHALEIAKTYRTDQQQWLSAAQNLRAPYWDWASNSVPPPEVISLQTVNIITADGRTTSVPNPLYQYTFNPIDPSFPSPWRSWRTTIRHPDDPRSPNATTDSQDLRRYDFTLPDSSIYRLLFLPKSDLQAIQGDITDSTYRLLSRVRTWPAFSNHSPGDGGSSSNSLESIHDEIHGMIGGHMGVVPVAGSSLCSRRSWAVSNLFFFSIRPYFLASSLQC